jgi:hypothetical protein
MGEFTLDATQNTQVTIKTKTRDGTVSEHHFEILAFTKPRFDAFSEHGKTIRRIQQHVEEAGSSTSEDQLELTSAMAAALDERVASTNGPVSITSLWDDGLIGFEHLRLLMERVNEEAVGPPA